MAIVQRRYRPQATTNNQLANNVGSTAQILLAVTGQVDVQVDDAESAGIVDALNEFMAERGYEFEDVASADSTLIMTSPDGTRWAVSVSDVGVLSTASLP